MIKIFRIRGMPYTPFSKEKDLNFLNQHGVVLTDNPVECDVFVAHRFRNSLPFRIKYGTRKQYLIWTHEPRYDTHFEKTVKGLWLPPVHVMNIYTGDIYLNNYYYASKRELKKLQPLAEETFPGFSHKKIVALMYYRNNQRRWSLKREERELDLCYLRTQIALEGYNLNKVDIYGKGWPKGIALEDSRDQDWSARKSEILKNYYFNLCFENTNTDYYCTEKIWDSILWGCLPIYYGKNNKIYEDFPEDSFLDYCDFKNSKEMFKYIDNMKNKEFINRMNLCIEASNKVYEKLTKSKNQIYEEMLLKIVQKLEEIVFKRQDNSQCLDNLESETRLT